MAIYLNTSMQTQPRGKRLRLAPEIHHEIRRNFKRKAELEETRKMDEAERREHEYKHNNVHCAQFNSSLKPTKDDCKTTAYQLANSGQEGQMISKLGKPKGDPVITDDGKQIQQYNRGILAYYENDDGKPVIEFTFKDGSKAVFTEHSQRTYVPEENTVTENGTTTKTHCDFGDQYLTNMQTQIYNANGELIMDRRALHPDERLPL